MFSKVIVSVLLLLSFQSHAGLLTDARFAVSRVTVTLENFGAKKMVRAREIFNCEPTTEESAMYAAAVPIVQRMFINLEQGVDILTGIAPADEEFLRKSVEKSYEKLESAGCVSRMVYDSFYEKVKLRK